MKIEIPVPCTEDKDKMTPVEGGSFCGKCEKKVFDFTEKSTGEIKTFFTEQEAGKKICAIFTTSQLLEINPIAIGFDSFFSRFRLWNFARKFAVIFYFVFGLALSGCGSDSVDGKVKVMGDSIAITSINDTLSAQIERAVAKEDSLKITSPQNNVVRTEKVAAESDLKQDEKKHPPPLPIAPSYKEGRQQMEKIIASNLKYPEAARLNKIEGTVKVAFKVTVDGKLKNIQTDGKLGYGCDEEAIRLVKLLKEWNPATRGREKMEMNFGVNVEFKLK
ncbi:MAG: energy transducer TonB [Bacteroidia bacterium]|nr:energy transducer TonB [Bacteroidia bacterium]